MRFPLLAKLFLILIISIFPLYSVCIKLNVSAVEDTEKSIINFTQSKFEFLKAGIENAFSNAIQKERVLLKNKSLEALCSVQDNNSSYERFESMLQVKEALMQISDESPFFKGAFVIVPPIGKTISDYAIENITEEHIYFMDRVNEISALSFPFIEVDGRIFVVLSFAKMFMSTSYPECIIGIEMSKEEISKTIDRFMEYEEGVAALLKSSWGLNIMDKTETWEIQGIESFINDDDHSSFSWDDKFVVYSKSQLLGTTFVAFYHNNQLFGNVAKYSKWLWVITVYTVIILLIFVFSVSQMISKPLRKLTKGFKMVTGGDLGAALQYKSNDEFGYIYQKFNEMTQTIKDLIEKVYEQRIRTQSAETKQLQYQINPHFFYNSLYLIYRMAKYRDYEIIMKISLHLGDFYKYITRGIGGEAYFKDEVKHSKDYLLVQSLRFEDRISIEFDEIPNGLGEILVPKLILQPLIENAIAHGLEQKTENGLLKVGMEHKNGTLTISIEDNGSGIPDEKIRIISQQLEETEKEIEVTGLINVQRRIRIKFGESSTLQLSKSQLGGLKVSMIITLERGENDV